MTNLRRATALLTPSERVQGLRVLCLVALMAVFESAGVVAIMPFLAVLADPAMIESNRLLAALHAAAGAPPTQTFLLWLGLGAMGFIIVGALVRTITEFTLNRFIQLRVHSFGSRLLESYLRQPYSFFVSRHSGDLQRAILSEAEKVVTNVYWPSMMMISNGTILLALVIVLIAVDPLVALGAAAVLGGAYAVVYTVVRGHLRRIGADGVVQNQKRFQAASEALGGIKGIRLAGAERHYLARFTEPSEALARRMSASNTISHVPKYAIEAIGFAGVLGIALLMLTRHGGNAATMGEVLPLIGLYAFAGYRLLPAVQAIYRGFTMLRFGDAGLESIAADLALAEGGRELPRRRAEPMPLRDAVALESVDFTYPGSDGVGLHGVSLRIPAGARVGIVGRTGAGKTTLVDMLLGLLEPRSGRLLVDGAPITAETLRAWQRSIGYVPQDIYLRDGTVAENIAFATPTDSIDPARVEASARLARLHDFVTQELPSGYQTQVGERGVRLSGGQRQRIGIARALYHDPELLVFDEATSALDNQTEREVMDAISTLGGGKTILMIAHRLSTVQNCDMIVVMDHGRVAATGTYESLLAESPHFREIATAA
jgi:ABC-type multidrug transport system fused ATPase/permease subunit